MTYWSTKILKLPVGFTRTCGMLIIVIYLLFENNFTSHIMRDINKHKKLIIVRVYVVVFVKNCL